MKNLLSFVFLLFHLLLFAQNGVKSEKELAKNFIQILQTQNLKNLEAIAANAEIYQLFVETFKEKSKKEIQNILTNNKNSLSRKFQNIFHYFSVLEIENEKITIQKISKPEELYLIAPNYYQIPLQISLQGITDTIFLEAYKHKKRWYLTDFTSTQSIPLQNILRKCSKYSVEQYREILKSYWEQKEYNKMLIIIEKLRLIGIEDSETLYYEGLAYKATGNTHKANNAFRQAYALAYSQETDPQIIFELFEFYANASYYYDAYLLGEICINNNYQIAKVIPQMLNLLEKERKAYTPEGTKLRNSPSFYASYKKILDMALSKVTSLSDKDKVRVFSWKAELDMEDEKWLQAKEYFLKALAIEPANFDFLYELAWIENETQQYSKALEYAQKAYQIKKTPEILAEMAYSKKNLNNCQQAITDYNTLFAMGEEFITASKLKNRGDCYRMLKNNKLACADYQKVLQMGENDDELRNWVKKNCK